MLELIRQYDSLFEFKRKWKISTPVKKRLVNQNIKLVLEKINLENMTDTDCIEKDLSVGTVYENVGENSGTAFDSKTGLSLFHSYLYELVKFLTRLFFYNEFQILKGLWGERQK